MHRARGSSRLSSAWLPGWTTQQTTMVRATACGWRRGLQISRAAGPGLTPCRAKSPPFPSRLVPTSPAILGGDSDLLLMALVAARPNLSVISDTQAIFAGRTPYMSDVAEAMRTHGLMAFSTDALRQVWQRAPESRDFAKASPAIPQSPAIHTPHTVSISGAPTLRDSASSVPLPIVRTPLRVPAPL